MQYDTLTVKYCKGAIEYTRTQYDSLNRIEYREFIQDVNYHPERSWSNFTKYRYENNIAFVYFEEIDMLDEDAIIYKKEEE